MLILQNEKKKNLKRLQRECGFIEIGIQRLSDDVLQLHHLYRLLSKSNIGKWNDGSHLIFIISLLYWLERLDLDL